MNTTLFLNGVYAEILGDIADVHQELPEQILFLQPYSQHSIRELREHPPSVEMPMGLLASITSDLSHVHYAGEIVGWSDKRALSDSQRSLIEKIILSLQEHETYGLYRKLGDRDCVNLLHIRRLRKLEQPLPVESLTKISDGQPLSPDRTQAGGWSYVLAPNELTQL